VFQSRFEHGGQDGEVGAIFHRESLMTLDAFPVLAMRSAPESSSRGKNFFALRTDLRQRMPAVDAGTSRSELRATMYERRKKESGTPNDAEPYPPHLSMRRALCKARSPIGVPPRL
jgi:hypothetical protein